MCSHTRTDYVIKGGKFWFYDWKKKFPELWLEAYVGFGGCVRKTLPRNIGRKVLK